METKTRKPLIAALLSLVTPGLGQMYNGEIKKGIIFYFVLSFVMPLLLFAKLQYSLIGLIILLLTIITVYLSNSVEACFTARKKKEINLKIYNKWYFYILFVAIAFTINTGIEKATGDFRTILGTKAYKIPSGAMLPTILIGDRIIVDLKYYTTHNPQRGDIIVFKYPEDESRDFIKRVIATGNDVIESKDRIIYISGVPIAEPYVEHVDNNIRANDKRDNFGPLTVPKDKIFVMGDNRDQSYDSRFWGYVDKTQIRGKALYFYWSEQTNKIGKEIK
jgi:signal peptidase I